MKNLLTIVLVLLSITAFSQMTVIKDLSCKGKNVDSLYFHLNLAAISLKTNEILLKSNIYFVKDKGSVDVFNVKVELPKSIRDAIFELYEIEVKKEYKLEDSDILKE